MSMNCYCPKNGNIYWNKTNEYLKEKREKMMLQKSKQNNYDNMSLSKKLSKRREMVSGDLKG